MSKGKAVLHKGKNPDTTHPIRAYSDTTDMLIVQMIDEWNYTPALIAALLYRDKADVAAHIAELERTGRADDVREFLRGNSSLYVYRTKNNKGRKSFA
ncbi:hypothetical protein [Mahella australiensis]|uniref:Uncharacterized protein n=1 Tax=Mahella australiensis (strain DSM 15567 / CIP 107919 / 50-1 BON) TaxID=697281 RepID=F3ZWV5_MAHA5|nr:hypothetical protein [Mahella australiensis]AEE97577.1 hypothetical protein Mahau_2414 [Mahella australiensis 50-1 BON]